MNCHDRNSFQSVLILIGLLGAINHNNIDGTFLRIESQAELLRTKRLARLPTLAQWTWCLRR
jgi:hypothetical protein